MKTGRHFSRLLGMAALSVLIQCGGKGTESNNSPNTPNATPIPQPIQNVTVSVNPPSSSLNTGGSTTVTATVSGTTNTGVTWSVDGVPSGNESLGTIIGEGSTITYTAPATSGNHTLTAVSVADRSKSASSILTVAEVPPDISSVSVTLTPTSTNITTSAILALTVSVTGTTNTAVHWTVDDIALGNAIVGTISGSGNIVAYNAPASASTHTIKATSAANATKSASTTVNVQDPCAPAPTSSLVVNVKDANYGAKGDGITDDTLAIQRAVNAVAGTGGTVSIPDGTYRVNALQTNNRGILLLSNMTLRMASGAVLKAIPNASQNYAVLSIDSASNVNIIGGAIEGERSAHTGTGGEWGMGILFKHAERVFIQGVTARECWGDGFCVTDQSKDITFCGVISDHNRRQGLSIISVDGMVIRNSTFKNTTGTLPEDGIDIEPNSGQTVNNLLITGCTFWNNAGDGLEDGVPGKFTGLAFVHNVVIDGNTFSGNGKNSLSTSPRSGIEVTNISGHRILNNTVTNNIGYGILLRNQTTSTTVTGNIIRGNSRNGILVDSSPGNTISGNTLSENGVAP